MLGRTVYVVTLAVIGVATSHSYANAQTVTRPVRVIVSYRDSTADIYRVNLDGTLGENLTHEIVIPQGAIELTEDTKAMAFMGCPIVMKKPFRLSSLHAYIEEAAKENSC